MSTTSDPLPPGWERHQVAQPGFVEIGGQRVWHVYGWDIVRHCGCTIGLGMRLDKMEPTAGVTPCPEHEAQARRALEVLKHTPPSDQEVGQMYAETLERELSIAP
jgi:hypothetical protein